MIFGAGLALIILNYMQYSHRKGEVLWFSSLAFASLFAVYLISRFIRDGRLSKVVASVAYTGVVGIAGYNALEWGLNRYTF